MIGITGSTGFIGNYILQKVQMPVKVFARNPLKVQFKPSIEIYQGNLGSSDDIDNFVINCPTLLHLACNSNPLLSEGRFIPDLENNLVPTVRLFESYAKNNPDGHIIFTSTGGNMYDDTPFTKSKTEEDMPCPRSGYGVHKLAAEHYLRLIAESYGIKATILRISNPYGALVDSSRTQGLIGVAFAKILANEPLYVYDSEDTLRDYIHLDDIVSAIEILLHKKGPKDVSLYNISSGKGIAIREVIEGIEEVTNAKLQVEYTPESFLKNPSWSILSCEKANKELNWVPTVPFREGLMRMHLQSQILQHL